MLEIYAMTI